MLACVVAALLAQPTGMELTPLPPISMTTGSRAEAVVLEISPTGQVTRTVRTDHLVAPLKGTLTEVEHLKLQTIAEFFTVPPKKKKPEVAELNTWQLTITVGKTTVTVKSPDELDAKWAGVKQVLGDIERRLMKPAPRKK